MAASFVAAYIAFIITGAYTLTFVGLKFTQDPYIKAWLFFVLLLNGTFYHYFAAYTEMKEEVRTALKAAPRGEWLVRIINQTLLFALWFLMERGWGWFSLAMVSLYATYLIWDRLTWRYFTRHTVFWLDLAGFVVTILFVSIGWNIAKGDPKLPPSTRAMFFWAITTAFYFAIVVAGFLLVKFWPLGKNYVTRPEMR